MKLAALLIALTTAALGLAQQDFHTASSWIWYPERPAVEGAGQTRYMRHAFDLKAAPTKATIRVMADDSVKFTVNGQPAPEPTEHGPCWAGYDLTKVLKAGENVLGFAVFNSGGPGGLLVTGTIREANGTVIPIVTDERFKTSRKAAPGWDAPGFDASSWKPARILGNAFMQPWYGNAAFDLAPFITKQDMANYDVWKRKMIALPPGLSDEKPAVAKIGYVRGNAALTINGVPRPALLYRGTVDPMTTHGRRQLALFRDAGVHVYTGYMPLATLWPEPGKRDFSKLDDYVRAYLSVDPKAYMILILRLVPPPWWMKAHPEEMVHYAAGPGFNTTDEAGRVERPSFASKLWRKDMEGLWRDCIRHLEHEPWGKRVIGYQPGYGIYTEWHYFGSWTNQMPDTGPAMTAYFREWLRKKYKTEAALRAAWADPKASFATAQVPGVAPRVASDMLGFRDPQKRRWVMDYYLCQQELTGQCILGFCRAAKEETHGRVICGAFYGYWYDVLPQTQGGHLELQKLLKSPYIDYFAAPYDYEHRLMGDDGRLRCLPQAFQLAGKVHMVEADTRTFLHPINEYGRTATAAASVAAIRREGSTALTTPAALWWCDFGANGNGGWYDDPRLIGTVRDLYALAKRRLEQTRKPVAQVALVCDPMSMYLLPDAEAMHTHEQMLDTVTGELYRTGTPFDSFLLSELPKADLSRYKMLIFLDTLIVDPAERARIQAATKGHEVLWMWAPGISDGKRLSTDFVRDLTGFDVAVRGNGTSVGEVVANSHDPLVAGLPMQKRISLTVERTAPIRGATDAAEWFNPRGKEEMKNYKAYDWTVRDGALRWHFDTTYAWTDIHLKVGLPQCDGVRLTVRGEGGVVGMSMQIVLKDANKAEFVAPRRAVGAAAQTYTFALADFKRAPWPLGSADKMTLPISGLKIVLDGKSGAKGTLALSGLSAVWGKVVEGQEHGYALPFPHPCLVVDDHAAEVLGRDAQTGEVVVAARGKAPDRQVLSTAPFVPHELLRAMMKEAGVNIYVDSPDVILRADNNLVAMHTAKSGTYVLHLPHAAEVRDAITGKVVGKGKDIPVEMKAPVTRLLELR